MSSTATTTTSPGEDPGQQLRNRFSKAEQTARVEEYKAKRQKLRRFTFTTTEPRSGYAITSTQTSPVPGFRLLTSTRTLQKVQHTGRSFGLDTIAFWIPRGQYNISETHSLKREETIAETGEVESVKLYRNSKLCSVNVNSDGSAYVNLNVSNALNGISESISDIQAAVDKANHWLKRTGITTSLCAAPLSRLDIAVTAHLPRTYSAYTSTLDGCNLSRTEAVTYEATRYWKTTRREVAVYDKGAQELQRTASTDLVRLELRLKQRGEVKKHTGCSTLLDLYAAPERLQAAYNAQAEALLPEAVSAMETDAEPGESAGLMIELLSEMEGARSPVKKLLQAKALADLPPGEEKRLLNAVGDTFGRSKRSRFKKGLKELRPMIETFREPGDRTADRLAELRSAFILAESE